MWKRPDPPGSPSIRRSRGPGRTRIDGLAQRDRGQTEELGTRAEGGARLRARPPASAALRRFALLVLLALVPGCERALRPGEPDGVVLVTLDTLRADHLSTYGYARTTAPFLDSLAERGVVFTRAHSTISHTAPSHASIFTGLSPPRHGVLVNGDELSPSVPCVARVFGEAGYRTGAFTSASFVKRTATGFQIVNGQLRPGAKTVDTAVAWLERLRPEERFFLWVHLFDVHEAGLTGVAAPPACYAAIRERTSLDPDAFYAHLARLHGLPDPPPGEAFPRVAWESAHGAGNGRPAFLTSRAEVLACIEHYDAEIAYVDHQVERLYEAARRLRPGAALLWVITADHGEGLGNHGYRGHGGFVYEEQLHVPLFFHATDGSLAPGRRDAVVSLVDLFPTLAELPGRARAWPDLEGVSLWPYLIGDGAGDGDEDSLRVVFAQRRPLPNAEDDLFTALSAWHQYILHTGADDEFFDLDSDPSELRSRPGAPDAARYRELLEAHVERMQREGPVGGAPSAEVPADVLEELEGLGYVR